MYVESGEISAVTDWKSSRLNVRNVEDIEGSGV